MNIDPKDYEKIMSKIDTMKSKKKLTDPNKYFYWDTKADEYVDLMVENKHDKDKYAQYYHQAMLYTLERNKYFKMPRREVVLMRLVLKHHNSINKDKPLKCDSKGWKI